MNRADIIQQLQRALDEQGYLSIAAMPEHGLQIGSIFPEGSSMNGEYIQGPFVVVANGTREEHALQCERFFDRPKLNFPDDTPFFRVNAE